jgi:hypothetical protein
LGIRYQQSWFPQHFAITLGVRNNISEDDIRVMLSLDPSPMHRLSKKEGGAYIMRDKGGRCALHLVAQYSESLELLKDILQIDQKMTNSVFEAQITPLGLLCSRPHFPTFDVMVLSLIEVNSSVEVISDGMMKHLMSYAECLYQDISPGSRVA